MKNPIDNFWNLKLEVLKKELEKNNFQVFIAGNREEAKDIALEKIIANLDIKTVSWGGSMTFVSTGLFHALRDDEKYDVIDTFDQNFTFEEKMELRRQSLMVDLFITGTNAVTESGHLVNLDMIGNRVAAITWGPKNVILFIGRNKICADLDAAMFRIKNIAAPVNTMNLDKNTPCARKGFCHDCSSPDRICNTWTITEKCLPEKRIKIILINEDSGF